MKQCKHCKRQVSGAHHCEVADRQIDGDSILNLVGSLFDSDSGGYDGGSCDSGSDFGSCGGD